MFTRGRMSGHAFEYEGEEEHQHQYEGGAGGISKSSQQREEIERAFGVFMPAVSTELWLNRLQKYDFDVFREELRRREWRLPWRGYWAFRRGCFERSNPTHPLLYDNTAARKETYLLQKMCIRTFQV